MKKRILAALAALFLFTPPASAEWWTPGETVTVEVYCLSLEAANRSASAYSVGGAAHGNAVYAALAKAGECVETLRSTAVLMERFTAYPVSDAPYQASALEVWSLNLHGRLVYALYSLPPAGYTGDPGHTHEEEGRDV